MKSFYLLIAIALLFGDGCAPNRPYRTYPREQGAAHAKPATEGVEEGAEYTLGFVEFDDQGALWNPKELDAVIHRVHEIASNDPVLLVVFVHGWKHNASENDQNVQLIRNTLQALSLTEKKSSDEKNRPRKVVGVYVGWRGLSIKPPVLKEFTFWTRKNTAHEVGYGGVAEVFVRLENEILTANRVRDEHSSMISIGHSFGGAVVFSALSGILTDRILSHQVGYSSTGLGDLVILINPAFEATKMQPLADAVARAAAQSATNAPGEAMNAAGWHARPALAVITSKGDEATKIYFPLGRIFSTLGESYRSSAQRKADRTAVGHYTKLITHDLRLKNTNSVNAVENRQSAAATNSVESIEKSAKQIGAVKKQLRAQQASGRPQPLEFSETILQPRARHTETSPVMIIYADNKIINGHNDIARPVFLGFLHEFILSLSQNQSEESSAE